MGLPVRPRQLLNMKNIRLFVVVVVTGFKRRKYVEICGVTNASYARRRCEFRVISFHVDLVSFLNGRHQRKRAQAAGSQPLGCIRFARDPCALAVTQPSICCRSTPENVFQEKCHTWNLTSLACCARQGLERKMFFGGAVKSALASRN